MDEIHWVNIARPRNNQNSTHAVDFYYKKLLMLFFMGEKSTDFQETHFVILM